MIKSGGLFIAIVVALGFSVPSKEIVITGVVKSNIPATQDIFTIEFREDSIVGEKVAVWNDSVFQVTIAVKETVDVYVGGMGIPRRYVKSITSADHDSISLTLEVPAKYNVVLGKAVCPKCGKRDQTERIEYGDGTEGGCIVSEYDPEYKCKRDGIWF